MKEVLEPLLIVGAGGLARETAAAVHAINSVEPKWDLLGFLDDDPRKTGNDLCGVSVIGPIDALSDYPAARLVIPVASPTNYLSRRLLAERLNLEDERYATIIHPTATVGTGSEIGAGSILLAHTDLTCSVEIGRHVAVMPQVVLPHDVLIDDWATLCSGVRLGGGCHIKSGAYIGGAASLRENVTVGEWSMVGMAAVVTRNIPSGRLWFGSPARDRSPAPVQLPADPVR